MQLQVKEKKPLEINGQLIYLLIMAMIVGVSVGTWLFGVELAPLSAREFIDQCDRWVGKGGWNVINNTCMPINYIVIPDDVNLSVPMRGR